MALTITWLGTLSGGAGAVTAGADRVGKGVASDFMTVAMSQGLERPGLEPGAVGLAPGSLGVVHESTGIYMVEYPLSYLGVRKYMVQEIGVERLPPRFRGASPTDWVRVLHTPSEINKPEFVRTAYLAPCVQPVVAPNGRAKHPDTVHARYAPVEICGMLGTSHRVVETRLGPVPVLPAGLYTARAQDAFKAGADGSSLSYDFDLAFAEQLGDQQCGEVKFRAVADYDVVHVMGTVNHMIVACTVDQSRGKLASSARLIFDCDTRSALCYGPCMQFTIPAKVAKAIKASDLAITLPDDTPREVLKFLQDLTAATTEALDQRDAMAGQVASAETTIAEQTAALAQADDLLFTTRQVAVRDAIKVAADMGVVVKAKHALALKDGKPVVEDATGVDSPTEVKRLVVKAKGATSASYDTMPDGAKDAYVEAKWEGLLAQHKVGTSNAQDTTPGGLPRIDPAKLQQQWRNQNPNGKPQGHAGAGEPQGEGARGKPGR